MNVAEQFVMPDAWLLIRRYIVELLLNRLSLDLLHGFELALDIEWCGF